MIDSCIERRPPDRITVEDLLKYIRLNREGDLPDPGEEDVELEYGAEMEWACEREKRD
jgi:hypothetical protein